jgi:hypothetical protein
MGELCVGYYSFKNLTLLYLIILDNRMWLHIYFIDYISMCRMNPWMNPLQMSTYFLFLSTSLGLKILPNILWLEIIPSAYPIRISTTSY